MSKTKNRILIPVSPAELMDKLAILEIKSEKITDPVKLQNVKKEKETLEGVFRKEIKMTAELEVLFRELKKASLKGWKIEDIKRECERREDFGTEFINAARGAFKNNDERAEIWKKINTLLKSEIVQEKSYEKY